MQFNWLKCKCIDLTHISWEIVYFRFDYICVFSLVLFHVCYDLSMCDLKTSSDQVKRSQRRQNNTFKFVFFSYRCETKTLISDLKYRKCRHTYTINNRDVVWQHFNKMLRVSFIWIWLFALSKSLLIPYLFFFFFFLPINDSIAWVIIFLETHLKPSTRNEKIICIHIS